ncbi:hypothetical protein ACSNOI_34190 [Actinomadura kijaniata]|uniref:hypothetical protein n=1 Tax=Actinomadura kijaniata TaxID=46161 RepID=UPI003F1B21D1
MERMDIVAEGAALALAGEGAETFAANGADLVVGPAGTVIVADAGSDPDAGGVWSHTSFRLVGPVPERLAERFLGRGPWSDSWPSLGREPASRPIHLFVRLPEGACYLGTGEHARSGWSHDPHVLDECVLMLDPPLDRATLDRVRPVDPPAGLPGLEWLEHVDGDRARALRMFVTGWHRPEATDLEILAPPFPVPWQLAEFYLLAQERPNVLGVQNFIVPPAGLRRDAGRITFGHENQGGFAWALDPSGADPAVLVSCDGEEWHAESEPLSGFLLQFSLYEAAMSAPYHAVAHSVPERLLREMTGGWRRVPLEPFLAPLHPTSFHVAPGLVAHVHDGWVWIGATHRAALAPLAGLDAEWTSFDG